MSGKGSKRRPRGRVTEEEFAQNWDAVFGRKPHRMPPMNEVEEGQVEHHWALPKPETIADEIAAGPRRPLASGGSLVQVNGQLVRLDHTSSLNAELRAASERPLRVGERLL